MAGSVNRVILIGHLGRDPEVRNTQGGAKVVNLALATTETWNDKSSGERKKKSEWHRVVIFNEKLADLAERYLRKGSHIYVEGSLATRKFTDSQGNERYQTEVVLARYRGEITMLGANGSSGGQSQGQRQSEPQQQRQPQQNGNGRQQGGQQWAGDIDDEIPF